MGSDSEDGMAKRDVEKLMGDLEDAKTSVEEIRGGEIDPEQDSRLEEVQEVLESTTDALEDESDND